MELEYQKDATLKEMVLKLKNHFKPLKIYLFGSRANKTANADSDYDLFLIVKDSKKSRRDRAVEAMNLLNDRKIPIDIFVYTQAEFDENKDEFSSIPHSVATEGVELDFA